MLPLLLTFLLINVMFFVARYTSRAIERCARKNYWYMRQRDPAHKDAAQTKVLPRQRLGYREMLAAYLTQLESEQYAKTRWECMVWLWYCNNVSEAWRARTAPDGLPAWAETLAAAYNNVYVYNAALLCVFFALSLLSAPLWMPLMGHGDADAPVLHNTSETRRLAISALVGRALYTCDSAHAGEFCFVEETDLNESLAQRPRTSAAASHVVWHDRRAVPHRYANTAHGVHLVSDGALRDTLAQLHDTTLCACAVFLGLRDNVTLMYDGAAWTVQWRPVIQRANAFATEIRSTVRYHTSSPLFDANERAQQEARLGELVHHDAFVVEYDETLPPEDDALHGMSYQLRALSPRPVLFQRATMRRHRVQLRGDNAICYVYCDQMNVKLTSKTGVE